MDLGFLFPQDGGQVIPQNCSRTHTISGSSDKEFNPGTKRDNTMTKSTTVLLCFVTKWSASELNSGHLCFNSHRHERVCLPLMLGKPANLTVSTAHQICSTTFNEAKPGLHPAFSAAESAPTCHGCYHQMHGTG